MERLMVSNLENSGKYRGHIGLVTLYQNNYGSVLQCYATKRYLKQNGFKCDLLFEDNKGLAKIKGDFWRIGRIIFFSIFSKEYRKNRKQIKYNAVITEKRISPGSQFALNLFTKAVLQPKGVDTLLIHSQKFIEQYDYFITGSDQVWNGANLVSPFRFLNFAPNNKKVALSPSFGVEKIKNFNILNFRREISKFPHLSAREESGVSIIRELTGKEAPRLADPIILLEKSDWREFAKEGINYKEPYVFVHFLDVPSKNAIQSIKYISDTYKCSIVCFAYPYTEYDHLNCEFINGGPKDYVALISGARCVCTDSFHSSYFSIIFNVPFYVFERNYNHDNKQNTRLNNLLEIYKCKDRFIETSKTRSLNLVLSNVNFDGIRTIERENLRSYLLNSLVVREHKDPIPSLKEEERCTGCTACASACPVGVISFINSELGYRLPSIDSLKCIQCGTCEKVCKKYCVNNHSFLTKSYISYNTEDNYRNKSASGGTFSGIARAFIENEGYVCGCELSFSNGIPVVKHIIIDSVHDIDKIIGSKYVESDCSDVYQPIADLLRKKKRVLFCGTSCQVKALNSFLAIKHVDCSELYTIDLICHGVPGIKLFHDYIEYISKKYQGICVDFKFREKYDDTIHYEEHAFILSNGTIKEIVIPSSQSSYYSLFMRYESYREACYHCEYATINKPSDVTIGDYFEAKKDYPNLFEEGGYLEAIPYFNALIIHNPKGEFLLKVASETINKVEVDSNIIQYSHRQLCNPPNYSYIRLRIQKAYKKLGFMGINKVLSREGLWRNSFLRKAFRKI